MTESPIIIVRLSTYYYNNDRGIHMKKSLLYVKKKSTGFNFLKEDCLMQGTDAVFPIIINLNECTDGLYQVVTCNERTDWETGSVEEWNYKLIPYKEKEI